MSEQPTELAKAVSDPGPATKHNRGWFRASDPRINRSGRPKGPELAARRARAGQPLSGRLMRLFVPESDYRQALTGLKHPWVVNLPRDFTFVAAALDPSRNGFVLTIHSNEFGVVEEGDAIPEFQPSYHNLIWRKKPRQ